MQYTDKKGTISVKEIDLYDEQLYSASSFDSDNRTYYVLQSHGQYSKKSWSENVRIATIENESIRLHGNFFPDSFIRKNIKRDAYLEKIWFLDNDEDEIGLPLNGYIHDNCLTLHNGGSTAAKTINLKFDKKNLLFSYDELARTHSLFAEPTGKKLESQLINVNK